MYTLIQNIFSNGERFPMLVNADGVPDYWPTLFTSQRLRDLTQTSITSCLSSIQHLYKWQKINDQDLINDFANSKIPGREFVESIKEHCGLTAEQIHKELSQQTKHKKVVFANLKLARSSALSQVSCDYQKRRMHDISSYLMFVGREMLKNKKNSKVLIGELNSLGRLIEANYPRSRFSRNNKQLPHAEKEAFEKFLEIFKTDSKDNPFLGYELKLRNYLLVQLLYWTGVRSGEVLSMTLDDVDYDVVSPKVKVVRRHDDVNDSRKYQPVAKTKSREIAIPTWLRDELDYYINRVRNKFSASKTHPYIFVSHKGLTAGKPITNSTFYNRVIMPVKEIDSQAFELIKRHGFRHLFNERLSDKIDEHNQKINTQIAEAEKKNLSHSIGQLKKQLISDQQEIDMRTYLNGHSSKDSAEPYIQRGVKRKAQLIHKEMMQDLSHQINQIRGR